MAAHDLTAEDSLVRGQEDRQRHHDGRDHADREHLQSSDGGRVTEG